MACNNEIVGELAIDERTPDGEQNVSSPNAS